MQAGSISHAGIPGHRGISAGPGGSQLRPLLTLPAATISAGVLAQARIKSEIPPMGRHILKSYLNRLLAEGFIDGILCLLLCWFCACWFCAWVDFPNCMMPEADQPQLGAPGPNIKYSMASMGHTTARPGA